MNNNNLKKNIFYILQPYGESNHKGLWFDWFLILLIVANVVAVMLETMPSINQQYSSQLFLFEVFSVVIFTAEYIARIWTCTLDSEQESLHASDFSQRLYFMLRPMSVVDLLAILPFYLSMFIGLDLRVLRLFRLIRLMKLGRYSVAMQTLQIVIAREYRVIIAALGMLMIVMVVAATIMYHLERTAQPDHFGTIPAALWWSVVTLSTVGYGDVAPITPAGQFFAGMFILIGVALFALPAGILASSFTEQMSLRRDKFRSSVMDMLAQGHLALADLEKLDHVRRTLRLDKQEAEILFTTIKKQVDSKQMTNPIQCPHCHKAIKPK
jgi:voltage-gated potassium channel